MNEFTPKRAYSAFISGSADAPAWERLTQCEREAWQRATDAVQSAYQTCPHCGSEYKYCLYCDRKCLGCGGRLTCRPCEDKAATRANEIAKLATKPAKAKATKRRRTTA
jgi:hypothetical protein